MAVVVPVVAVVVALKGAVAVRKAQEVQEVVVELRDQR